jgi:phosphatidylglycerophosphate synthase
MDEQKLTLNNIRLSYAKGKRDQDREDLWIYYVIRKISFYPTWLFLRLGINANQATYISIIVEVFGCSFLAFGNYGSRIIGALLVNFWIVLDCIDGNIARYREASSDYGEFIDALGGYLLNAILFLSVGIGAFRYPESSFRFVNRIFVGNLGETILVVLGAWGSLAMIFSRLILHKFLNVFSQAQSIEIPSDVESRKGFGHTIYLIVHNIVSFSGFLTPILLLAVIFRTLSIFVSFYALMNTIILIFTTHRILVKSRRLEAEES